MTKQRLFILSPTAVFAARVNQASFSYPIGSVAFDGVTTGAYTAVLEGMTVLFGSSAGADDKGRQRVRLNAADGTLYIGRSSQNTKDGEVDLEDNDYITVLGNDYRVWSKIPAMDGATTYKDHDLAYTDQNEETPPKANIKDGARAGTVGVSETLELDFDGTDSYAAADGATLTTYSWNVGDGTITAGADTDSITATFPAGFRWVSLTVTDSNGKSHTMRVPVYAHDEPLSECVAFRCLEHTVTAEGQRCSFEILEDIPIADYPDGTLVIFWEGEPASAADSSNVKFWGWHQTDDNSITAEKEATLKGTVLHCLDGAGRLDTLPGFSQSITGKAAPANWLEMLTPNMDKFIDYLLRWHSTAFELMYYTPSGTGSDYPFVILDSPGESLFDQVQNRAKALVPGHVFTCNRHGELRVIVDPLLQADADRTAVSQETIGADDWTGVNWTRMRPPRVHWIWGDAVLAHATQIAAVFSVVPGLAPGQGETEQASGRQLARSQDDLNICEGMRYARTNALNSLLPIRLMDDFDIEPADMSWVTLNVPVAYNRRGVGFVSNRGLPVELTINYSYGREGLTKTVEMLWEQETSGPPATTYIPPEPDWDPPYVPPPGDVPTPPPSIEGTGFGTVYVQTNSILGRTRDFGASSPAWSNISPSGTYTARDFILDPWNPALRALHLSSAGVNISENMNLTTPTWSLSLSTAAMESATGKTLVALYKIVGSINQEDYFGFLGTFDSSAYYIYTTNGGTSWNYSAIVTSLMSGYSTFDIVPHVVSGNLLLYAYLHRNNDSYLYTSSNAGSTWSFIRSFGLASSDRANMMHCPYQNNSDGQLLYYGYIGGGGGTMFKSTDGGANDSQLSGPADGGTQIKRGGFEAYTQDSQRLLWWAESDGGLWISTNGGTSWTEAAASGITGTPRAAGGFPYNGQQYYVVTTNGIFVSIDGGATFINKTGDWSFGFSTTNPTEVFEQVVVPLWVAE